MSEIISTFIFGMQNILLSFEIKYFQTNSKDVQKASKIPILCSTKPHGEVRASKWNAIFLDILFSVLLREANLVRLVASALCPMIPTPKQQLFSTVS